MSSAPEVSVVVPHFHDLESLAQCIAALERQSLRAETFEIVVADNASPEGEAAVAALLGGRARLVTVAERGAGPARNGGVAQARGRILAFTDCDCRPEPEWLEKGLEALRGFDFVGGRMKVLVDDPQKMTPAEAFEAEFAFNNEAYVKQKGFTVTANLFCPREVFDRVGGFRVGVSEDFDWSHRALGQGFRLGYAEMAVVGHPARRSWPDLQKKWRRLNAETYAIYAAERGGKLRWLLRSLALPGSALAHTPRILTSRKLHHPRDRLLALAVLYRLRLWRFWDALRLASGGVAA
ncbi:glycosyltransferase family 2 protein [Phenylobacterium koreense]|uniref:Glycosyltransferase involved in cell wall biosynthesis n=1 Tax=Phenylobacterium koreense TaxID=266125 RepID=A0ABV2EM96_9CAUL